MKQVITVCLVMCVLAVRASPWPNRDTPIANRSKLPIEKQIELFPEYLPVFREAEDFPCAHFRIPNVKCRMYSSVFYLVSLKDLDSLKSEQSIEKRDTWTYIGETNSWVNLYRNMWKTNNGQPDRNPFESNGSTRNTQSPPPVNSGNRRTMRPQSNQPPSSSSIQFPIGVNIEDTPGLGPFKKDQTTSRPLHPESTKTQFSSPSGVPDGNRPQHPESTKTQFSAPSGVPDGNHQESVALVGATPLEPPKVDAKPLVADSVFETMFKVRDLCEDVSTGCWENSIFSPLSINSISALLWTGSSGNTESQLRSFLGYPEDAPDVEAAYNELVRDISSRFRTDQNMQVKVANRLFLFNTTLDAQFEEKFKRNDYGSVWKFDRVNADAIKMINDWVASQTNNKINNVVDQLHPKSQLVGVNTVYFKGQWMEPFGTEFTREADFKVTQEETIRVLMMTGDSDVGYVENADLGCKMISIPYKDPNLAMHLVLPTEPHGLKQLEGKLNSEVLKKLIGSMDVKSVSINLPKFRISKKQSLKTRLFQLGVKELFTPNGADLSRMIPGGGVAVDEMMHEAFIQVSEAGTEAAAATTVFLTRGTTMRKFIADQPFLFFIRDKSTGIVYFYGRVVRPEEFNSEV